MRGLGTVPTAREVAQRSLRKRKHRADVQVFELGIVAFQLRNRFLLPKPVHVLAKGLRVDGLLVNVRLDQSIFLLLNALEPPTQTRLFVAGLFLRLVPDVQDFLFEDADELGRGLQLVQQVHKALFKRLRPDVHPTPRAPRLALIVAIAFLGPGRCQRDAMDAPDQTLQGKLSAGQLARFPRSCASSIEDRLGTPERLRVNEGREVACAFNAPLVYANHADVERVAEHSAKDLLVKVEPSCLGPVG